MVVFELYKYHAGTKESKCDSPVPLVFGQKSDLMSKYEYINYIHTLIYSTICMIKSFLKFNVHICIFPPRIFFLEKYAADQNMVKPLYFMIKAMVSCRLSLKKNNPTMCPVSSASKALSTVGITPPAPRITQPGMSSHQMNQGETSLFCRTS